MSRRRSARRATASAGPDAPPRSATRTTAGRLLSLLAAVVGLASAPLSWAAQTRNDTRLSPLDRAGAAPSRPAPAASTGCRLLLSEYRSGRPLHALALDPHHPLAIVSFTHSVLGTPVSDHYLFRPAGDGWRAHLVEERFEGSGYGLPHLAGAGETLTREGASWRLQLDRVIEPLVILPLPSQHMRVRVPPGAREFPLGDFSTRSIQLRAQDCPPS